MKKALQIIFYIILYFSINHIAFAESKIANKIFGSKDCSQYSTKTFKGLSEDAISGQGDMFSATTPEGAFYVAFAF